MSQNPTLKRDPGFYYPSNEYVPTNEFHELVQAILEKRGGGWRIKQSHFWTYVIPPFRHRKVQGWKIHLSAHHGTAADLLGIVVPILAEKGVEFKFASDRNILTRLLSKNCERSAGGKFVTIYPANEKDFLEIAALLAQALDEFDGPYILSDKQYPGSNVVFYRYGGFAHMSAVDVFGTAVSQILDGDYVPIEDRREARHVLPDFVAEPAMLRALAEKEAGLPVAMEEGEIFQRFEFLSALKHSNAGGVYLARDSADARFVVKEARPFIGQDDSGDDAIVRLKKEYAILSSLAHLDIAPRPVMYAVQWRHHYFVQTFIAGDNLRKVLGTDNLLLRPNSTPAQVVAWFNRCIGVARQVAQALLALHRLDIVFGDLSLNNILFNEATGKVCLIDFEGACRLGVDKANRIFTPGFRAPHRLQADCALEDDIYAFGVVLLSIVSPYGALLQIKPTYAREFLDDVVAERGIPSAFADLVLDMLANRVPDMTTALARLDALDATLRPAPGHDRNGYPLDLPKIFDCVQANFDPAANGAELPYNQPFRRTDTLDHGLAGILFSWHYVCGSVPGRLLDYLHANVHERTGLPGLLTGNAGVAWMATVTGNRELATRALEAAGMHELLVQHASYGYGAAGYGMSCLKYWLAFDDGRYLKQALWIADYLVATAEWSGQEQCCWREPGSGDDIPLGLFSGGAGVALFLLYCYLVGHDQRYLETGAAALRFDVGHAREITGAIGFARSTRPARNVIYPYYGYGSAGIASVLARYGRITRDEWYRDQYRRITSGVAQRYTITAGWENGLAGLGVCLLDGIAFLGESLDRELGDIVDGLRLLAIHRADGIAFAHSIPPKISFDLIQGGAGVAMFLHWLKIGGASPFFVLDELMPNRF